MDFFIKKIFDGKDDDVFVHLQFQKYSRGEFRDKALVKAKNSKGLYSISTTAEYANELVRAVAEKLTKKTKVEGVVVSTMDLKNQLKFSDIKQFMGVKQYKINTEMDSQEIINLCDKFPSCFIALSFTTEDGTELKIKQKAPKSAKPSTKTDEKPPVDFCKIKTSDKKFVKNLLFDLDVDNFKNVEIDHDFIIEDIEVDYSIKDPKEMREKAKRKGKVVRKIDIDGKKEIKEKRFIA